MGAAEKDLITDGKGVTVGAPDPTTGAAPVLTTNTSLGHEFLPPPSSDLNFSFRDTGPVAEAKVVEPAKPVTKTKLSLVRGPEVEVERQREPSESKGLLQRIAETPFGKFVVEFQHEVTAGAGAIAAFVFRGADIQAAVAKSGTAGAVVTSACLALLGIAATAGGAWARRGDNVPF